MSAATDVALLTVGTARRELSRRFKDAGVETPELDARLLVGAVLKLDLTAMVAKPDARLSRSDAEQLAALADRRLGGEPVARILGEKEFWGLRIVLSRDALVPRSDTETVVAAALDFARARSSDRPLHIADIGTGSGAILLALLNELANATGVGTDIATGALACARRNAERLGVVERATFIRSDYCSALDGSFDLIVSNPPYIRSGDIDSLAPEVRNHEPRRALDGGVDGLDAYRTLSEQVPSRLSVGGMLIVEVGYDQADDVAQLIEAAGLAIQRPYRCDLSGVSRVIEGTRTGP